MFHGACGAPRIPWLARSASPSPSRGGSPSRSAKWQDVSIVFHGSSPHRAGPLSLADSNAIVDFPPLLGDPVCDSDDARAVGSFGCKHEEALRTHRAREQASSRLSRASHTRPLNVAQLTNVKTKMMRALSGGRCRRTEPNRDIQTHDQGARNRHSVIDLHP